jgi:hypothetical protein
MALLSINNMWLGLVVSSPPATETGGMGREIESHLEAFFKSYGVFLKFHTTLSARFLLEKLTSEHLFLSSNLPTISLFVAAVLSLYFMFLNFNESTSTVLYHTFNTFCYFSPILGALLADSYLGKFRCQFLRSPQEVNFGPWR